MSFTEPECSSGKRVYLTWQHASNDAAAMRRNHKRSDARPYSCRVCHKFHTGGSI